MSDWAGVPVPGVKPGDIELFDMEVERVRGKLRAPLRTSRGEIADRETLVVRLSANVVGFTIHGIGEAAPLEGWSEERLSQVRFELGRLRDMVFAGACSSPHDAMARLRAPTARFALSSALLDMVAHARRKPLRHLFDLDAPHRIPVNATIGMISPSDAALRAEEAVASGFRTIKLKAGSGDVARVAAVREAAPDVALRLDANGAWDVETAHERLGELERFDIEYAEQPVGSIEEMVALRPNTAIRIAADENCLPLSQAHRIIVEQAADVLVLKPALLGTWSEIIALVDAAQAVNIDVVFTSALDSAVGRTVVAQVAAGVLPGATCGLSTVWVDEAQDREQRIRAGWLHLGSGNGLGL